MNKKKSGGLLVGIILIILGSVLLIYNEKNNVKNIKTVKEIEKVAITIPSDKVDTSNEGRLVALNGDFIVEDEKVEDYNFGVDIKSALLKRKVEVYQWKEEEDTSNNTTTYSYKKEWSDSIIDSSNFNDSNHQNPSQKAYEDELYPANTVRVGEFYLSYEQKKALSTSNNLSLSNIDTTKIPYGYKIVGNYITNSENPDSPQIGDVRVSFTYNNYTSASVLARQTSNTFTDYISEAGKTVNRVFDGKLTLSQMVSKIQTENNTLKWLLRLGGAFIIIMGYLALFSGLNRLLEYIPILGKIASGIINFIAFLLGLIQSLLIIIIAWFVYRPLLSIILLVIVVALIVMIITISKKNKKNDQPETVSVTPENTI